jgi:hypothetical protein
MPAKRGNEEIFRSLCTKRREWREIITKIHSEGLTYKNGKNQAGACGELGRLMRIGEVTDALGVANGSLKSLLDKMHIRMPRQRRIARLENGS